MEEVVGGRPCKGVSWPRHTRAYLWEGGVGGGGSAAAGVLDIAGRVDICQANTLIN